VILSAGAIETPLILERSGIGRPDVLSRAGVEARVESPNVGERVIEQHGAAIQVRFTREIGHTLVELSCCLPAWASRHPVNPRSTSRGSSRGSLPSRHSPPLGIDTHIVMRALLLDAMPGSA
jgi:choline dehydrogenase-like flavoprotein